MMFTPTENYNLSYADRERIAYANGDVELAKFYAGLDDAEQDEEAACTEEDYEEDYEEDDVQKLEDIVEELQTDLGYMNKAFNLLEKQYDELKVKYDALTARLAA